MWNEHVTLFIAFYYRTRLAPLIHGRGFNPFRVLLNGCVPITVHESQLHVNFEYPTHIATIIDLKLIIDLKFLILNWRCDYLS